MEPKSSRFACRFPKRLVDGVGLSTVGFAAPGHGLARGSKQVHASVGRATIHDDVLDIEVRLAGDGAQVVRKPRRLIERRGEDGNHWTGLACR